MTREQGPVLTVTHDRQQGEARLEAATRRERRAVPARNSANCRAHAPFASGRLARAPTSGAGLAAVSVLVVLALVGGPRNLAAQGTLEGRVRAAGTGAALAGAQVSLVDLGLGGAAGPQGLYRISGIPAGTHDVAVSFVGYGTQLREIVVADGETTRLDLELSQAAIALEGLVTVGSRARPRAVTASPVPVDAIASADFVNQGDTDLSSLLRNIAPSYNVNIQPIADAATISRPANLRNLAPDHTLVLVNGKRRHRAAAIAWFGNGVADGAQGPDIAVVPAIALRQVEILRDGASAQYGSDAIAGVMNFQLRDDRSGGSFEARMGSYPIAGDGQSYTVAGNVGLPLGETGFANFSAEYGNAGPTSRSVQRDDARRLVMAGNSAVATPAQVWGSPDIADNVKLWGNFGAFLGDAVQLYGHGNYAARTVVGGFYFRNPNERQAIYSNDQGRTLLIADMLDARDGVLDGSAACPEVRIVGGVPDPVAFAKVKEDPNCFSFQEILPGGYTPQFGADLLDGSVTAGLKGETGFGLHWDASASFGSNRLDFFIDQTTNASLGPDTPLSFDLGSYQQQELNFHADLSYRINDMVNLAGGGEWRDERFEIIGGQRESWEFGPLAAQGFRAASDGFPGFGPLSVGDWSRSNYAFYGDAEMRDPDDDRWTLGGALRFEDFSDFGVTVNGKLAGRYSLTGAVGVRGSVSTGFRAPTPGQQNAFNVTTEFDREINAPVNKATIASTSAVARLRGGKQLQPEESLNIALGAVLELGSLNLTADYFRIAVTQRISLTQDFRLDPAEVEQLLAEGIASAANVRDFRFFTNDFDTRTQGVDVVATYEPAAFDGATVFTLLFNHTDTKVTKWSDAVIDARRIRELQEALPRTRWSLSASHAPEPWRFLARLNYYGGWYDSEDVRFYDGDPTVDLEAAYALSESTSFALGGQNVLNQFPDLNPTAGLVGNPYSEYTPYGFNGAFFYVRMNYLWRWE